MTVKLEQYLKNILGEANCTVYLITARLPKKTKKKKTSYIGQPL